MEAQIITDEMIESSANEYATRMFDNFGDDPTYPAIGDIYLAGAKWAMEQYEQRLADAEFDRDCNASQRNAGLKMLTQRDEAIKVMREALKHGAYTYERPTVIKQVLRRALTKAQEILCSESVRAELENEQNQKDSQ